MEEAFRILSTVFFFSCEMIKSHSRNDNLKVLQVGTHRGETWWENPHMKTTSQGTPIFQPEEGKQAKMDAAEVCVIPDCHQVSGLDRPE